MNIEMAFLFPILMVGYFSIQSFRGVGIGLLGVLMLFLSSVSLVMGLMCLFPLNSSLGGGTYVTNATGWLCALMLYFFFVSYKAESLKIGWGGCAVLKDSSRLYRGPRFINVCAFGYPQIFNNVSGRLTIFINFAYEGGKTIEGSVTLKYRTDFSTAARRYPVNKDMAKEALFLLGKHFHKMQDKTFKKPLCLSDKCTPEEAFRAVVKGADGQSHVFVSPVHFDIVKIRDVRVSLDGRKIRIPSPFLC